MTESKPDIMLSDYMRDQLFSDIELPDRLARLHSIEVEIIRNLRERPRSTWCVGCDRILWATWRKANGLPWRPDGGS